MDSSECGFCGKVGISKISNNLSIPEYPNYTAKEKEKLMKSCLEKDDTDFNLGNDIYNSDPDIISNYIIKRELPEILNRKTNPHDVIFVPDPFNYGNIEGKVVLTEAGQAHLPSDVRERLKKFDPNLKGAEIEMEIYQKFKQVFGEKTKNTVVFNGWKDNGKNKTKMREYDFLLLSEPLRAVIHIEVKAGRTEANIKKAAEQLESGETFFRSKITFPEDENWSYLKVMCFGKTNESMNVTNDVCSNCGLFVIFSSDDLANWWNLIVEKITSVSNSNELTSTFEGALKFLFFQMLMQGDPITEGQVLRNSEDNANKSCSAKNGFFWTRTQHFLMTNNCLNRVAFTSSFGTGKTFLLQAKAMELLKKKQIVIFVIFSDSEKMLLKQMYHEKFKFSKDARVHSYVTSNVIISAKDFLNKLVTENPESNFFMDEVDNSSVDEKTLIEMSQNVSQTSFLWIAYQNQTPPSISTLKKGNEFYIPNMTIPLRYSKKMLMTCETHKSNVKGRRWPCDDVPSNYLLNSGHKSVVLEMKPETSTVHAVIHVAEILQRLNVRTIIKIDFEIKDIQAQLLKTSIKNRVVLEENSEEFFKFKNKILIVTSTSDRIVKGIEVPLLVVFSNNQTWELTEDIFSRCISKLIVVCNEENAKKFVSSSNENDFVEIIPVNENLMPNMLEDAIKNDEFREFGEQLFGYRRPVSVNIRNESGQTPLILISAHGRQEMAEELFSRYNKGEIEINVCDNIGLSALHYSKMGGFIKLTELLVTNGADINASDKNGFTALHLAAKKGDLKNLRHLINTKLCDKDQKTNDGRAALHLAIENRHLDVVKYLVNECGADFNLKDNDGWTPLHLASENGHLDVVKYLVNECGADVNLKDNDGWTPLHDASFNGHLDVKYLVKECGADVNLKNNDGLTPLHLASQNGHLDVVKYLVKECGADVNLKNNDGLSPLHLASYNGHLDVVKYLVNECGADVNLTNNDGQKPSDYARNSEIKTFLLESEEKNNK